MKDSAAPRELCGPLAMQLGDTDVDRHDEINVGELDGSCKDIASLIRCSGLAPSGEEEYDVMARRTASHTAFSVMLVFRHGPPQRLMGLEQFVNGASKHVSPSWPQLPSSGCRLRPPLSGLAYQTRGGTTRSPYWYGSMKGMANKDVLLFPSLSVDDCVTHSRFDNVYMCRHSPP